MKRARRRLLAVLGAALALLYLGNASWRAAPPRDPRARLIAHRGVHQTFHRADLDADTCTAARIDPPSHDLIEDTIPSMRAAFAAGADVVEFDVHPTTDGRLVVFHDWTLDCRTDGHGVTRGHDLATLQRLDVGYGYTADGGRTFPLRGRGVGLMPALEEVFATFPDGRFLLNFKSREAREGDLLAAVLDEHPGWRAAVWGVYGGDDPTSRAVTLLASADGAGRGKRLHAWTRRGLVACLTRYAALGWTGHVPAPCRGTTIMIPVNVAPWLWGWPDLLLQRFRDAGTDVILTGPYRAGDPGTSGIDTAEDLAQVPAQFSGWLWTNRIERIGPALKERR